MAILFCLFASPMQDGDGKQLTPGQSAASGFVAACIGPTLNNPFDVVKASPLVACRAVLVLLCRAWPG